MHARVAMSVRVRRICRPDPRVMFSVDYPMDDNQAGADFRAPYPMDDETWRKVGSDNALRLFGPRILAKLGA